MLKKIKKKWYWIICLAALLWFYFSLPNELFKNPTCTVIEDNKGNLLTARIAKDGQWRFPYNQNIPEKFKKAVLYFEDEYFYYHPGINPFSLFRALKQNISEGRIISGGSTITMQVIRLSRKGKSRTIFEKFIECILAIRAESKYSKDELLALYTSNTPFGGNVVGLDAAAWRYYGREPSQLSWAEIATLAVLPNAPSLIYPGKRHNELLKKRNFLLRKLMKAGEIDFTTYKLAISEPLPLKPVPLPQTASHLLTRAYNEGYDGQRIKTTIDYALQQKVEKIVNSHHERLRKNEIYNAAALILDIESGNVLVYIGNTSNKEEEYGSDVDVITAPRSTGSILKPFLYASMLMDGEILPKTLVPDIPTQIAGYSPKNFDQTYDGAVYADEALYRSLNIPAVRMLQEYGLEKFHYKLKKLKLSTITKPADYYGLSIILGGAEGTLWDISSAYASMARTLNHFSKYSSRYNTEDFHKANYFLNNTIKSAYKADEQNSIFNAASIWLTFNALRKVNRPKEEQGWEDYSSAPDIAWKTGTSFGLRDAWAMGITPKYVIGIWVGNADGEGRPGLTGLEAAAPILFDIYKILPKTAWFNPPYDELVKIPICRKSGYRASNICETVDSIYVQLAGLRTMSCPYHRIVHLSKDGKYQVTSKCADVSEMIHKSWFVLPPIQEWYYKSNNAEYTVLPPYAPNCVSEDQEHAMDIIYPKDLTSIFVPVELDGSAGKTIFKVAHRINNTTIFWHLDDNFIGSTKNIHEMSLNPTKGKHILTLVDENGETLIQKFEIIER